MCAALSGEARRSGHESIMHIANLTGKRDLVSLYDEFQRAPETQAAIPATSAERYWQLLDLIAFSTSIRPKL